MTTARRSRPGGRRRLAALLFGAAATLAADQTVTVGPGLSFSPATVTIAPGEAVIWDFQSRHTATSDAMTGPEVWDSGIRSSGTFSHTFQTAGTYPYYCALHSFPGGTMMNGVVNVKGAGATPTAIPTAPPTETAPPTVTPSTSPSPTPLPFATATPPPTSAGPAPAGIPLLDPFGRVLLALALAAAGIAAISFAARR